MKKIIALLLCLAFVVAIFAACNKANNTETPSGNDGVTNLPPENESGENDGENENGNENQEPVPEPVAPIDPSTLRAAKNYIPDSGAVLTAYTNYSAETFEGVCQHYYDAGYALYCSSDINGNLFKTFTKGDALAHVYWIDSDQELNIVTDPNGAIGLPENIADTSGLKPTSITQLQQKTTQTSGMAYIIKLSDGSFIIYDGGYQDTATELMDTLIDLNDGSKENIHIRAWLITHSHDDHYSCFSQFSQTQKRYKLGVTLDCVMIAPVNDNDSIKLDTDANYLTATIHTDLEKFEGAKICYVYTGMTFNLANVKLEILLTPDEIFIDGGITYFNETSIVSRITAINPEESGETLGMMFLGDAGNEVAKRLMLYYQAELRTEMIQISHHGVENFPLLAYQMIRPAILFYPCNTDLYNLTNRDADVRQALRISPVTKEILLRDDELYTRYLNPELNPIQ